jgi:hypothetical protein
MATATTAKDDKQVAGKKIEVTNNTTRNLSVDVMVDGKKETFHWEPSLKKKDNPLINKAVMSVSTFELLKKQKGFAAMTEDNTFSVKYL